MFLNGILEEEDYIKQLKGFFDPKKKNMVCKLHKNLYCLKQAPREWYARLHNYLVKIGFVRTNDNNNIYLKTSSNNEILLSKTCVDDIIFGGREALCKSFADEMKKEFEMSMFGEIKFFVGLQLYQMKQGIFINQSKYIKEILETFGIEDSRLVSTPIDT